MIRESSSPDKLTARRSLVQRLLSSEQRVLHRQIVLLSQQHQILVANEVLLVRREAVQVVLRERGSGRVLVHASSCGRCVPTEKRLRDLTPRVKSRSG